MRPRGRPHGPPTSASEIPSHSRIGRVEGLPATTELGAKKVCLSWNSQLSRALAPAKEGWLGMPEAGSLSRNSGKTIWRFGLVPPRGAAGYGKPLHGWQTFRN